MRSSSIIATIVAAASMAVATPSATVNNNCDHPVYLWAVSDTQGPCQTLAPGQSRSQEYQINPNGGGSSIKISPKDDASSDITQFEYTYTPGSVFGAIFYDISNINGEPFSDVLTELVPELNGASNTSSCSTVQCPKNQAQCVGAYNWWNDDQATHSCPEGTSLTFNVCSKSESSGSTSSSNNDNNNAPQANAQQQSSPSPAPETPSPTPTPAASPTPTPNPVQQEVQTTVVTVKQQVAATPAAAAPASGYALQWSEGDALVSEGKIAKRHANHMERHARISRMHHARSMA